MTAPQSALVNELRKPSAYPHPCTCVEVIETHISWVLLTGIRAYKIKKAIDLGFADFTDLNDRRHFCEEEIRLNGRLAPDIYLNVVPITSTKDGVQIDGDGPVVEYAVCMLQFDKDQVLSQFPLEQITDVQIDDLADELAAFHVASAAAPESTPFGTANDIWQPVRDNFRVLGQADTCSCELVEDVEFRAGFHFERLRPRLERRRFEGRIRECHGDLHLGNMFLQGDRIAVFDGIEFNESLRWIDVANDLAFLIMDLEDHNQHRLANRLLNRWLERTGDYGALAVLPFYCSYRAAVRAKVDVIRIHQPELTFSDQRHLANHCQHYLQLAKEYLVRQRSSLTITMGVSGSGKTTVTQRLIETGSSVRIRSDVERKRMQGLAMEDSSTSEQKERMYSTEVNAAVYRRLEELATVVIDACLPVIVDATFLKRSQRQRFARLAECLGVPFQIVQCHASEDVIQQRIQARRRHGKDASEAGLDVLAAQLQTIEELDAEEMQRVANG